MANENASGSKDRVNIVYKTQGDAAEKELPFKLLILGDFSMREDPDLFASRSPIPVDRDNLDQVFRAIAPRVELLVPADLTLEESPGDFPVVMDLETLKDLEPQNIVEKVPPLKEASSVRRKVMAAQRALTNNPRLLSGLKKLLDDPGTRERLLKELQGR
jgi:type VI secretion system protein ImpB